MTLNDDLMTNGAFWLIILAAFVGLGVYAIITTRREVRKARAARRAEIWHAAAVHRTPVRIHPHCAVWGHKYRSHSMVWLCGVCGDRIPRNTLLLEEEDIA